MARIRVSGASGSSENTIIFIPSGGHSHDGVTSSLISTEKYSIYDFSPSFVNSNQSQTRAVRQENNRLAFESLVVNIVNQSVLVPAGIRLNPGTLNASAIIANTITATHIAANTITADELVSNVVLVNNIIRSNNFDGTIASNGAITVAGNNGWAISHYGQAAFSNVSIRGTVTSTSGRIGPFTLSSSGLTSVSDNAYSTTNFMQIENYGDILVRSHPDSGPHNNLYHETYIPGEFIQIKRTTSSWTNTGTGAFFGYLDADDETMLILNNSSGTYNFIASSNGNVNATGTITAAAFSGNATSASAVPASGITGQTGMWTSAARPGPYRLYRRDGDNDYSVQTYFTGSRWRLYGYNGDTAHADTHVGYADAAGSAGSTDTLSGTIVKFVGAGSSGEAAFWIHDQANGGSTTQAGYTAFLQASWLSGSTPMTTWGVGRDGLQAFIQQYYSGNSYSSRTITGASDRRVKENIEPISSVIDVLGVIDTIEPKIYDYLHYVNKKLDKNGDVTDEYNDAPKKFGFIAQELQSALGEYGDLVVDEIDDPRYDFKLLTTEDRGIIAIMWEAIRQLKAKIDILEAK